MIRKGTQIAILATFLVALGALATWDEWQTKKDEKSKETKGLLVSDIKPDDVTSIKFLSHGDSESGGNKTPQTGSENQKAQDKIVEISFERKDGKWMILSPVNTVADSQTVMDLLKNILEYKAENEMASGHDKWSTFGLEPPRRKIDIESATGKKLTFMVGNNTPVGFNAYVATSQSDKVFSGSQYIATATSKSLFEFRDKKVLQNFAAHEIKSLTLSSGKETTRLEKIDNSWELLSPTKAKADTVAINNLLDDLTNLKASEIIDQPDLALKSTLSSGKNLGVIDLQLPNQKILVKLIEGKNGLYATVNGQQIAFKLNEDIKSKILKSAKDLRDKKIFSFQSAEISSVIVDGQAFKKVANDWYSEGDASKFSGDGKFSGKPGEQPSPAAHIRGLVVDLEYARAEDVMDNSASLKLPKAPKHRVVLATNSSANKISIDAWLGTGAEAEHIWLKTSDSNKVYKVKKTVLAGITPQTSKPPVGDEMAMPPPAPISN